MPLSPVTTAARIDLRIAEMRLRAVWILAGSHHSWDAVLAATEVRPRPADWRLPWPPVEQEFSNTRR